MTKVNKRILIYSHEFAPLSGGIATYNVELAQGLLAYGYEVMVLAPSYGHQDAGDKKSSYPVWRPFSDQGFRPYKVLLSMVSLLIARFRYRPNLILATNKGAHRCLALLSPFMPLSYILVIHGSEVEEYFEGNGVMEPVLRRLFSGAKAIIAVSQSTRKLVLHYLPNVSAKTFVIYHGIRDMALQFDQEQLAKRQRIALGLDAGQKIILTVARLMPEKGQDHVILAMPEVLKHVPDARYLIVGGGDCERELKLLAEQCGVAHAVHFSGDVVRDEVWPFYAACDLFVMASRRGVGESFGIVFLEAAVFSKPAIAGNQGGMTEVIADEKTGLIVDSTDPGDIAQAIIRLLTDVELSRQIGQEARRQFEESFSIQKMIEQTVNVIENVQR